MRTTSLPLSSPFLTLFMLTVLYSNSYEVLEHALLEQLGTPAHASSLQQDGGGSTRGWAEWAESVVVPNRGCRYRLEQAIARRYGICANIDFSCLSAWLWTQMTCVVERPIPRAFSPAYLIWAIYRLLDPNALASASQEMARLRSYVEGLDDRARYSLACRIAALFDRYLTDRPDWLSAWADMQRGPTHFKPCASIPNALHAHPDMHWQAALWQSLCKTWGEDNVPSVQIERFLKQVRATGFTPPLQAWPTRVSLFVLPDIAPLHLTLLGALARWIDIRLYVLNPCKEYWYDIVSEASTAQVELREIAEKRSIDLYRESGNTLLAQWGQHTQRYLRNLQDSMHIGHAADASYYIEHPEQSALAALKNAVLNLQAYPSFSEGSRLSQTACPPSAYTENKVLDTRCIEVHSCHSLVRQLEVLHNRLLEQFAHTPDLHPSEVLVVVPDIGSAVPLIDAVFGVAQGARNIPYRHIGASPLEANPIAHVFMQLLTMAEQEVQLSNVLEWLHVDALAARFGIELAQIDTLEGWLHAAGAVRGIAEIGETKVGESDQQRGITFSDALMRLILGYALPEGAQPVLGWLPVICAQKGVLARENFSENPWESVHTQPELLGALIALCDALSNFAKAIAEARTALEWRPILREAIEQFFELDIAQADWIAALHTALYEVTQAMSLGAPDTLFSAAVLREALQAEIDAKAQTEPSGGGITFSDRTAHRTLPYRVIALIGMDAGVWPSVASADEFDLIAAFVREGDRHRREEERAQFLEYVLAAQDLLLITYTGRSLRDDSALPPAAPVDTLLDYLSRAVCGEKASPEQLELARQHCITLHPLHPFSAAYFAQKASRAGHALSTYDASHADIAAALALPTIQKKQKPFFGLCSTTKDSVSSVLHFNKVLRFWSHPVRSLLRDQWEITFPFSPTRAEDQALMDGESITADWRAREILAGKILPVLLDASAGKPNGEIEQGGDNKNHIAPNVREQAIQIARACPGWPSGVLGDLACIKEFEVLQAYANRVLQLQNGAPYSLAFDLIQPKLACPSVEDFLIDFLGKDGTAFKTNTPFMLQGILSGITPEGLVLHRYAHATARDYLFAWLHHLVLCVLAPDGVLRRTMWVGKAGSNAYFSFEEIDNASTHLAELLALYQAGCLKPLPFFLKSALAEVTKGPQAAQQIWQGNSHTQGESDDPYLRLGLRSEKGNAELSAAFVQLAHIVFTPLLAALSLSQDPKN